MPLSPLTNTNDIRFIQSIEADSLIDSWKKCFSIDISQELGSCTEIKLFQCNQTKLKFFYPASVEGSERLYEKLQAFNWYYMSNKWEYDVALQDLSDCKKILEIGSAFGSFLQQARSKEKDICGIELNQEAVLQGQIKGLPIEAVDLNQLANSYSDIFDGVCSFQVLEHVARPKEFINNSLKILKPGGKLIYCVPNSESFLKYQSNLLDMPPHHMTQWSIHTFKSLEKIFPIQLEKIRYEPLAKYHISGFLSSYSSHFTSLSPAFKAIFNGLTLPLFQRCLVRGARYLFRGQSIYVQFRKLQ